MEGRITSESFGNGETPRSETQPMTLSHTTEHTVSMREMSIAAGTVAVSAVIIYEVKKHVFPLIAQKLFDRKIDSQIRDIYRAALQ